MKTINCCIGNIKYFINILPTLFLCGFGSGTFLYICWFNLQLRFLISTEHSWFFANSNYFWIAPTLLYTRRPYERELKFGWLVWHFCFHWDFNEFAYWKHMCDLYSDDNNYDNE